MMKAARPAKAAAFEFCAFNQSRYQRPMES